jgi:hypothetical protein
MHPTIQLKHDGYTILHNVYNAEEIQSLTHRLTAALTADESSVLRSRGQTYGSRDLIRLLPEICDISRRPSLQQFISSIIGPRAGLVRALYFDKPPDRSWSLTWHKDHTIAVKRNDLPSAQFGRPTLKAGIPHVEAPESLLSTMLTLRLHLDPMTPDNGPLSVIPGSHLTSDDATGNTAAEPVEIHADAGDVFAMRPLLIHTSSQSKPGTTLHRRVIHLELAPTPDLPDNYEWHAYHSVT